MKTSITKVFSFEAAHKLPNHDGKCTNLHGHSYKLEITLTGEIISDGSKEGMIMDFSDLSKVVKSEIIEKWDHKFLNDILPFTTTAENLATEVFRILKSKNINVIRVCLWETAHSCASVEE